MELGHTLGSLTEKKKRIINLHSLLINIGGLWRRLCHRGLISIGNQALHFCIISLKQWRYNQTAR